jgi:hypothetical protein
MGFRRMAETSLSFNNPSIDEMAAGIIPGFALNEKRPA